MVSFFPYRLGIAHHAMDILTFLMSFSPGAGVISPEMIQRRRLL
jgi:hypothetical protein